MRPSQTLATDLTPQAELAAWDIAFGDPDSIPSQGLQGRRQVRGGSSAADFGKTGYESPEELEADTELKARIEAIRLQVGEMMNLGDVTKKTVPKMCLVAPPQHGGAICTRNFIPHRVHEAIGVFGAVSVATACVTPGSVAAQVATVTDPLSLEVEHPTGFFTVAMDVVVENNEVKVRRSALLRTARRLMRGEVYVPASIWDGSR